MTIIVSVDWTLPILLTLFVIMERRRAASSEERCKWNHPKYTNSMTTLS